MKLESAIPIAISRCRVWATGKGVNAKTQAKAAAAIAQWDAKKARANAKGAKVAASEAIDSDLTVGADALLRLTVFSASTYDDVVDKFLRLMS
jgi:hypothetical protein